MWPNRYSRRENTSAWELFLDKETELDERKEVKKEKEEHKEERYDKERTIRTTGWYTYHK